MNNLLIIHGHTVLELDSVDSTNNYAATLLKTGKASEGTVIMSHYQTSGRGQRGSIWLANPSENLTFSIINYPTFIHTSNLFLITQVTALAVRAFTADILPGVVEVKWPNDILVNGAKISGILLENGVMGQHVTSCISGIGININQLDFRGLNVTSLHLETGSKFDIKTLLAQFLPYFDSYYNMAKKGLVDEIQMEYLKYLYRRNDSATFRANNANFEGTITGVTDFGNLKIQTEKGEQTFAVKEVEFLDPL